MGLSHCPKPTAPVTRPPLPEPEDVFLAWLLSQPPGRDLVAAADLEIIRLRGYSGRHEGPKRLGEIFSQFRASLSEKRPWRLQ